MQKITENDEEYFQLVYGFLLGLTDGNHHLTVTLSTLLFLFTALVLNGGWAKRSKDIADYPEILTKEQNMLF